MLKYLKKAVEKPKEDIAAVRETVRESSKRSEKRAKQDFDTTLRSSITGLRKNSE